MFFFWGGGFVAYPPLPNISPISKSLSLAKNLRNYYMIEWIRKFFAIISQMECEISKFKALKTVLTHNSKSSRQVKATIKEMENENSTFQKPNQNK